MKLHAESNGSSIRYALCSVAMLLLAASTLMVASVESGASRICVRYSESTENVIAAIRPYDVECVAVGRKSRNNNNNVSV